MNLTKDTVFELYQYHQQTARMRGVFYAADGILLTHA